MSDTAATTTFADGTRLDRLSNGGLYWARALCSDGKVRAVRFPQGGHADTFFSVPAVCTIKGKTVTGFITVETREGFSVETAGDPAVVKFIGKGKNRDVFEVREIVIS